MPFSQIHKEIAKCSSELAINILLNIKFYWDDFMVYTLWIMSYTLPIMTGFSKGLNHIMHHKVVNELYFQV